MRRIHESSHRGDESSRTGRVWRFVAAGFAAGVAVTIPVMLVVASDDPGTAPLATPTTTAPLPMSAEPPEGQPTTTSVDPASTERPAVEETDLNTSETRVGTLRWTRVSGDADTVPSEAIERSPDGRYVSIEGSRTWWSEDGITWGHEPAAGFEDFQNVTFAGDWAIGWINPHPASDDQELSRVFERVADTWAEIELPAPRLPEIDGIDWSLSLSMPVEHGDTALIHLAAWGHIPWGDHYGVFEVRCGGAELCEMGPYSGSFDERNRIWDVVHPQTGSVMASVEMTVVDRSIEFIDTETRELVHTIETPDETNAQRVAAHLIDYSLRASGVFVRAGSAPFDFHEVPFAADRGNLLVAPAGEFTAFEIEHGNLGATDARVWTSADGITWTDRGTPSFFGGSAEWITFELQQDMVVATTITGFDPTSGEETYVAFESTNGLDWLAIPEPLPFPPWTDFYETNFGEVATAMPQSRHLFWISADGETWEEVEGPPGPHEPNGGGMAAAGAAGDILWVLVVDDIGSRTLWIGTFDG